VLLFFLLGRVRVCRKRALREEEEGGGWEEGGRRRRRALGLSAGCTLLPPVQAE
jgi:hypothetical protein